METIKDTAKELPKDLAVGPKEAVKNAPKETAQKYLVIKNFTLDKQYYKGNEFVSGNAKIVSNLLTHKYIK